MERGPLALRPYQSAAVYSARAALASIAPGRRRSVLLVSPTGSGKTVIGAEIVRRAIEKGKRALWLAHRTELVGQAHATLRGLGLHVGVVSATHVDGVDSSAPVQVASIDTLNARGERPPADLVIEDEAHHGAATTHHALLEHYREATLVGLTATPERADGSGLGGSLFSELVVVATHAELLEAGHIVPMEIIRPAAPLRPGQIAQKPADAWREHANGRQTIVFCQSVEHAKLVAGEFESAYVVDAHTPPRVRHACMTGFQDGQRPVICNVAVLTEGTDLPNTSCIILARGCGTAGLFLQMAGRGSRPAPGKQDCILIDLRGVSHLHGHPYDPREYHLDGRGIASKTEAAEQAFCRVCGAPVAPGEACAECGIGAKDRSITVTGDALVPYAAARAQGPDRRAANLKKWRAEQAQRKYKIGWAYVKYRAVYGSSPTAEIIKLSHARE